jgi:hypothetical protein
MTTPPARQPRGIPTGGQFAASTHAESAVTLGEPGDRFAGIVDVRELDCAASTALKPLLSADATDDDEALAGKIRDEWKARREQIFAVKRRQLADSYAERLETEAYAMLDKAARANLRNIADSLLEKHPEAATVTLTRDYDGGDLAIHVESVLDKDGNDIYNAKKLEQHPCDTAQELVSEYSSRQLNRFVDSGPVNLAEAASWSGWS